MTPIFGAEQVGLRDVTARWRQNRLLYPGWVVTPHLNRGRLWYYTEEWILEILRHLDELPPWQALLLLSELNWRLERVMFPVLKDWTPPIAATLRATDSLAVGHPDATEGMDTFTSEELKEIQEAWFSLAFALLKRGRQDGDEDFTLWSERLKPLVSKDVNWSARWFFEQCVHYLYQGDFVQVRATLESWPDVPILPWWEAKRAAVLAEIGELEEAEHRAESAIAEIRLREQESPEDFQLLSQEGWLMILLQVLDQNRQILSSINQSTTGPARTEDYRGRWAKLAAYRADPHLEVEYLSLKLAGLPPEPPVVRSVTYDPFTERSRYTYTLDMGSTIYAAHVPAFALLTVYEEGGLPFHCGGVSLYEKEIAQAAEWCATSSRNWSMKAVLRTGKSEGVKSWFDWIRIANLTSAEVDELFHLTSLILSQSSLDLAAESWARRRIAEARLRSSAIVMARLALRLSASQRKEAIRQFLGFYRAPAMRDNYLLLEVVVPVAAAILSYVDNQELIEYLPELLALPIPGTSRFQPQDLRNIQDPLDGLDADQLRPLAIELKPRLANEIVANLLQVAAQEGAQARRIALRRLWRLYTAGVLDDADKEVLARALWSRLDSETGLPADTDFALYSFLVLPEPEPGLASERLRTFLLGAPIPKYSHGGGRAFSYTDAPLEHFVNWLHATSHRGDLSYGAAANGVDWARDEVLGLLSRAIEWGEEEWRAVEAGTWPLQDLIDALRHTTEVLVRVIASVVLPRLNDDDKPVAGRAWQFLNDIEQRGTPVLAALPSFLPLMSDRTEEVASRIRRGLNSTREDTVADAAQAIRVWALGTHRQFLPELPESVVNELVNACVKRREPGYNDILASALSLVTQTPDMLSAEHMTNLCMALEYLLVETTTPDEQERLRLQRSGLYDQAAMIPKRRVLAARLARAMEPLIDSAAVQNRPSACSAIPEWRRAAATDTLPGVRAAFR